tara:strand:+ start:7305 stop:7472 length:168 start_codon:yes stop_codon:yes gene_type:complete
MCKNLLNIFNKNNKYNKLNETSKIIKDTLQETTYTLNNKETINEDYIFLYTEMIR